VEDDEEAVAVSLEASVATGTVGTDEFVEGGFVEAG
jgi:hypothetical protein